jgi:hypothetical protein
LSERISTAAQIARQYQSSNNGYLILLILTDGEITGIFPFLSLFFSLFLFLF